MREGEEGEECVESRGEGVMEFFPFKSVIFTPWEEGRCGGRGREEGREEGREGGREEGRDEGREGGRKGRREGGREEKSQLHTSAKNLTRS